MFLRTLTLPAYSFIGNFLEMSFSNNRTAELWPSFIPQIKKLDREDENLYSFEVYPHGFFNNFNAHQTFTKWAAVKVDDGCGNDAFSILNVPSGLYAVFLHKGPGVHAVKTYNYIFRDWIPQSGFEIDDRPHFAIM